MPPPAPSTVSAVTGRLHAAFGFREVARFKGVGFKFGRWLDVLYLELLLRPAPFLS